MTNPNETFPSGLARERRKTPRPEITDAQATEYAELETQRAKKCEEIEEARRQLPGHRTTPVGIKVLWAELGNIEAEIEKLTSEEKVSRLKEKFKERGFNLDNLLDLNKDQLLSLHRLLTEERKNCDKKEPFYGVLTDYIKFVARLIEEWAVLENRKLPPKDSEKLSAELQEAGISWGFENIDTLNSKQLETIRKILMRYDIKNKQISKRLALVERFLEKKRKRELFERLDSSKHTAEDAKRLNSMFPETRETPKEPLVETATQETQILETNEENIPEGLQKLLNTTSESGHGSWGHKSAEELRGLSTQLANYLSPDLPEKIQITIGEILEEIDLLIAQQKEKEPATTRVEEMEPAVTNKRDTKKEVVVRFTDGDKKNKREVEFEIRKPIASYSIEGLEKHLEWVKDQIKQPRLILIKELEALRAELAARKIEVEGALVEAPEETKPDKILELRNELAGKGISLDDLEGKSLYDLSVLGRQLQKELERFAHDSPERKFINEQLAIIEELIEEVGARDNIRLPREEYERLREQNATDYHIGFADLENLQRIERILGPLLQKYPGNKELERWLSHLDIKLKEGNLKLKQQETTIGETHEELVTPKSLTPETVIVEQPLSEVWTTAVSRKPEAKPDHTIEDDVALQRLDEEIRLEQQRLKEIERELREAEKEPESVVALTEKLNALRVQFKKTWKINSPKRIILSDAIRKLEWKIEDAEKEEAWKIEEAKGREEREIQERERKESIAKDREQNLFKYFLIDRMNSQAFRILCAATKETVSLERLNEIFGESGKTLTSLHFKQILPINKNIVWLTSNGFSLQLQNVEEVQGEKGIMIYDPKAKYKLIYPDWTYREGEPALNHEDGRRLMEQRAREYQEFFLAEFKKQQGQI